MSVIVRTMLLLTASNVFMTFAWYAHLKNLNDRKWYIAALVSWSIALFEYLLQVPANRIGHTELSVSQLKIMQEVITPLGVRPIRRALYAGTLEAGFFVGGFMPIGSGLFHVSVLAPAQPLRST